MRKFSYRSLEFTVIAVKHVKGRQRLFNTKSTY